MYKQFILFTGLFFTAFACGILNPSVSENDILFTVDGNPVGVEEFNYVYEKNNFNNDSIYTREDIDAYLELFINFKLKVLQAREEGYDTLSTFRTEFETYKKQLAKPYLTETKVNEQLVEMGGDGGIIAIDPEGNIALTFNTAGMNRASVNTEGELYVGIYQDE